MDTEVKRPRGRPRWEPPDLAQVRTLAGRGLTQEKIASVLDISLTTLYQRKRDYAHFAEALQKGKAEIESLVSDRLVQDALAGSFPDKAFFLERRCGWTKPSESETPSQTIRQAGLSSDLVSLLRQTLLNQLQAAQPTDERSIEVQPVRREPLTINDKRAELLGGRNGKHND